jgi:HK97 family phage prohead protease
MTVKNGIEFTENMERRAFKCDFRSAKAADGKITFMGHAAVFDTPQDMGWFVEEIKKGAFSIAIKEDDVRALFNHNPDHVLGRNIAGTLRMKEDDQGLAVEIDGPDTQLARDLKVSVDRGDITQMSFAFVIKKAEYDFDVEPNKRTILEVKLYDVSIVTYAAYPQTDVSARTFEKAKKDHDAEIARTIDANKNLLDLRKRQQKNSQED